MRCIHTQTHSYTQQSSKTNKQKRYALYNGAAQMLKNKYNYEQYNKSHPLPQAITKPIREAYP